MAGRAARIQPASWLLVGRSSSITATWVMGAFAVASLLAIIKRAMGQGL
jgi:hypothetical protein